MLGFKLNHVGNSGPGYKHNTFHVIHIYQDLCSLTQSQFIMQQILFMSVAVDIQYNPGYCLYSADYLATEFAKLSWYNAFACPFVYIKQNPNLT